MPSSASTITSTGENGRNRAVGPSGSARTRSPRRPATLASPAADRLQPRSSQAGSTKSARSLTEGSGRADRDAIVVELPGVLAIAGDGLVLLAPVSGQVVDPVAARHPHAQPGCLVQTAIFAALLPQCVPQGVRPEDASQGLRQRGGGGLQAADDCLLVVPLVPFGR